jgi:hypothetical protein
MTVMALIDMCIIIIRPITMSDIVTIALAKSLIVMLVNAMIIEIQPIPKIAA